jgi:hypothetical protein
VLKRQWTYWKAYLKVALIWVQIAFRYRQLKAVRSPGFAFPRSFRVVAFQVLSLLNSAPHPKSSQSPLPVNVSPDPRDISPSSPARLSPMSNASTPRSRMKKPRHETNFSRCYTLTRGKESIILNPNDTVQLFDRSLIQVEHFEQEITESPSPESYISITVFVVGRRYYRFRDVDDYAGFLSHDRQEVFKSESRHRVDVELISHKVILVKTNYLYPALQSQRQPQFICRYLQRRNGLIGLSPQQANPGPRTCVPDRQKRAVFVVGADRLRQHEPRYTFGDAFCGVGGCSAGARMAGLKITWAFDADSRTARIYSENFPRADVHVAPVHHFLASTELKNIDVMHISPPCQAWSLAHTVPGKDDDSNSASLFSIKELLLKCRPRVATMEQVCGLARKEDNKYPPAQLIRPFFKAMLRDFLEAGYSFDWKYIKTQDFGVPQIRERILLIAAW